MIKINLLGVPKPKRGKRSGGGASPEMGGGGGEGMNPMIPMVLLALVTLGGVWFFYNAETTRAAKIATDKAAAERENRALSEVKATFERKQREAENYKRRVEVIDQLRANQAGPVSLLTLVGDTVNATDAVWLSKLTDESGGIKIEGTALNVHAVANLMNNLQKTGYFKTVEMTESIQDDKTATTGDIQAFTFQITCEVNKATAPATSAQKS
jgi:type IV pilus assembly protein PilN